MASKHKKIIIPVFLLLLLALATGIYFASKPDDSGKPENQTQQNVDGSNEAGNQESEQENGKNDAGTTASSSTSAPQNHDDESAAGSGESDSSHSGSNSSSGSGSSSSSGGSGGSGKPAHQHSWHQHTAQRWVSNMVTVDDYEIQKVAIGTNFVFAEDGYTTSDINDAKAHAKELVLAGYIGNYHTETIYEEREVKVGSHQEDQGHYETYVDYEYCDCGARQ